MSKLNGLHKVKILDFESLEREINLQNLDAVKQEISCRSKRLRKRILHFSEQFGIPEQRYWDALEADPMGPLASTLAAEARRQNIHEKHAAAFIAQMDFVTDFVKLPPTGPNALYLNRDGQDVTRRQLGKAPKPSKSIDFQWNTRGMRCLAAQKYTKEGGGTQDNQFNELEQLLRNFAQRTYNQMALFILVDGAYYTEERLNLLQGLVRLQPPKSYVTSVNDLQNLLHYIATGS